MAIIRFVAIVSATLFGFGFVLSTSAYYWAGGEEF